MYCVLRKMLVGFVDSGSQDSACTFFGGTAGGVRVGVAEDVVVLRSSYCFYTEGLL